MTDWTPEEDEAFNDVERHSNLGKQILRAIGQPYVYAPKREWVGLTDEEIDQALLRTPLYAMTTAAAWRDGVRWAYHQLKDKNT